MTSGIAVSPTLHQQDVCIQGKRVKSMFSDRAEHESEELKEHEAPKGS